MAPPSRLSCRSHAWRCMEAHGRDHEQPADPAPGRGQTGQLSRCLTVVLCPGSGVLLEELCVKPPRPKRVERRVKKRCQKSFFGKQTLPYAAQVLMQQAIGASLHVIHS